MNKITIVALSVDSREAVLYQADGTTTVIPQGDARLPLIVAAAKEPLARREPVEVDITPIFARREEFDAAEQGTGGVVKFFRVAKSFLKKLVNTESPQEVPKEVAHVSPLEVGTFPGQEEPQPAVADELDVEASQEESNAVPPVVQIPQPVQQQQAQAKPVQTNDQKLDAAAERLNQLMDNGHTTDKAEFHAPLDESKETIVAVHTGTGAVIPDAQKLGRQLKASAKLKNYKGLEKFIERLSLIIDQRGHSVEDLMKFIELGDLPIADDGCIVIYKRLKPVSGERDVFVDVHSGKIRQKVGSYVFMRPGLVDPNRRQDCSNGLHVASLSYLRQFSGDVTVVAKVRPEDVFAVPQYSHNKMRVCGYHILAVLDNELRNLVNSGGSISSKPAGAELLNNILRGHHVGVRQHVEVGGQYGSNVTYKDVDVASADQLHPKKVELVNTTLDMEEKLEPVVPTAPAVKVEDVKAAPAKPEPVEEAKPVAEPKPAAPKKATHADTAKEMLEQIRNAQTSTVAEVAAAKLVAFKKSVRKGWNVLGLSTADVEFVERSLGKPTTEKPVITSITSNQGKVKAKGKAKSTKPKAAAKPEKPQVKSEDSQSEAIKLLKEGKLSNIEIARQTGLSKDQVYRLKKKL